MKLSSFSKCLPAFLFCFVLFFTDAHASTIVPKPVSITRQNTSFILKSTTPINLQDASDLMQQNGNYLAEQLLSYYNLSLTVEQNKKPQKDAINIALDSDLRTDEYILDVSQKSIRLVAGSDRGVFYGIQTLLQVIPSTYLSKTSADNLVVEGVKINDYPRFGYRGAMLDVCRHFFSVEEVKRFIDILALHKINTFHWHLTEDQGWRIEIKKYPKLTEIGSVRAQTLVNHYNDKVHLYDGEPYGGYYTQEQIKDVVAYAQKRFITIIPEIDMPGHVTAALAAYPQLACKANETFKVGEKWGVFKDVLCIGKESSFEFVENVLLEVMDLFPSKYIHIGGDECPTERWKKCPDCQKLMAAKGLNGESRLQNYFTGQVEAFLQEHGREIIGWDEILEGGISQTATIMSWRGTKGGIKAAQKGNNVIMTPGTHCYFDKYQSLKKNSEPLAIGGYIPVSKVYDFDPLAGLNEQEGQNVLGLQANLWTEYIKDFDHLQYMLLPRLAALAEVGWSSDTEDYDDFLIRLENLTKIYKAQDYNYARHIFTDIKGKFVDADSLTIVGKAMPTSKLYHRVDGEKYMDMPAPVKSLYTNSAGIAIAFQTNSSVISAKWEVQKNQVYPNIPRIGSMGLDLYIKKNGKWQFAGAGIPEDKYSEKYIVTDMDTSTKECLLYLPTYDEIVSLKIGVDEAAYILPAASPFVGKYVIYGSSITQGASASRAGMAYPARMSRATGLNFINLGLSGNGKMEKPVIDMLADIECDAFIMDCIANPSAEQIRERAPYAIRHLREKHPNTPIIFIQSVVREKGYFNAKVEVWNRQQNEAIAEVVKNLQNENIPYLYLIEEDDFLGTDHEGTVDGVHPNDLGFDRLINAVQPKIQAILELHKDL
ncbi:family 20 glycosylhydrolase [Maribellus luteus]|nr:family 20 glycosylhydrolase [Maribellus luteus]